MSGALVRLYLDVSRPGAPVTERGIRWTIPMVTDFAPDRGDHIQLWPSSSGHDRRNRHPVEDRWWDADGHLCVQLVRIFVDPSDDTQAAAADQTMPCTLWHRDIHGDLDRLLSDAGWKRYPS